MNIVRNLAVFLAAPLAACILCTTVWGLALSGFGSDWRPFIGVGIFALIIAMGGSAFLSLLFRTMSARAIAGRYAVLVGFGAAAGFLIMGILGVPSPFIFAGPIYGVTTACFWVGFHSALHRSR
jgi:hypothetical protein